MLSEKLKKDLANLSNNSQKISPPYLLFPEVIETEGKLIIAVAVPLSSQLHKSSGEIYLRSEDGDYKTEGTHQLAGLINRKLSLFSEQRAVHHLSMKDLRPDLFDKARRLMRSYNRHHPWAELSDEELLKIAGFFTADRETDYGQGIKFINVMDIFQGNFILAEKISGQILLLDKKIKENLVIEGDVLFNRTSEISEEIALTSVYLGNEKVVFERLKPNLAQRRG